MSFLLTLAIAAGIFSAFLIFVGACALILQEDDEDWGPPDCASKGSHNRWLQSVRHVCTVQNRMQPPLATRRRRPE